MPRFWGGVLTKDDVLTVFSSSSRLFNNCQLNSTSAYARIWHANCESSSESRLVLPRHLVNTKSGAKFGVLLLDA